MWLPGVVVAWKNKDVRNKRNTSCDITLFLTTMLPQDDESKQTRRNYSKDLKQLVLYQHESLGKNTQEISRDLNMSLRVVQRVLQLHKEIGSVVKDPKSYAKLGRAPLLDTNTVDVSPHNCCALTSLIYNQVYHSIA
jgi:hypothetical protein